MNQQLRQTTASTQITTPSPTPSTPCTSTIKDIIKTLIKVQDFTTLWDKSCAEYKNAPRKKLTLQASIAKEMNLEGRRYLKNSCKKKKSYHPNLLLKNKNMNLLNCRHSKLTFTQ